MRYKSVIVTKRGAPEVLQVIENDLRAPLAGEARIKILTTCVCLPDVQARYGHTPFAPRVPFVPGYAIIGVVDAVGRQKRLFSWRCEYEKAELHRKMDDQERRSTCR